MALTLRRNFLAKIAKYAKRDHGCTAKSWRAWRLGESSSVLSKWHWAAADTLKLDAAAAVRGTSARAAPLRVGMSNQ
jgi:hypothetical protein